MSQSGDWYSYGQIQFRRKHIMFILENWTALSTGWGWPPDPRETGYNDAPISAVCFNREGKQVKPSIVLAETEQRLEQCVRKNGKDGAAVLAHYRDGVDIPTLAKVARTNQSDLEYWMGKAIDYAGSGPCRRWITCYDCLQKETCLRYRERRPVIYQDWLNHKRS